MVPTTHPGALEHALLPPQRPPAALLSHTAFLSGAQRSLGVPEDDLQEEGSWDRPSPRLARPIWLKSGPLLSSKLHMHKTQLLPSNCFSKWSQLSLLVLENSYFLQLSEPEEQPQTEKLPVLSMHQAKEKIIKIKIGGEKFSSVK